MITRAFIIQNVIPTGASNTPTVTLVDVTQSNAQIGTTVTLSQSASVGGVVSIPGIAAGGFVIKAGDVLQVNLINPTATITVAAQIDVQIEWNATT